MAQKVGYAESVWFHIGSKKVKEGRPESDKYTSWFEA